MQSPRHNPPPSAAAPKPKGILKNAGERSMSTSSASGTAAAPSSERVDEHGNRLVWDETNLTLHEIERENTAARMKIDEPKTPFVRSASLGSIGDDDGFNLDGSGILSSEAGPSRTGASEDDVLAANTSANAGPRGSGSAAVGADAMELASGSSSSAAAVGGASTSETDYQAPSARSTSRSPSFSLPPSSRRSSSASNRDARSGVREEMRARDQMDVDDGAGAGEAVGADDDEDNEDEDEETKAQKEAFAKKRNAHYGNEAEAMRIAKALAEQEDEGEDEEDDEEAMEGGETRSGGNAVPPVPPLPNGRS